MCWLFVGLIFVSITVAVVSSEIWPEKNRVFRTSTIHPREWIDFLVSRGADFAFYSPLTRAWQFLIGALLALRSFERAKIKNLKSSGLITIALVSVLTFATAQETVFLTWSRLGATFLTAAIIFRGSTWLSKEWLISIGDRSYSLYLWHYPLIVIFKGINLDWVFIPSLLLIALFAELSFRYIEKPYRQLNFNRSKKRRISRTLPTVLVLLGFCVVVLRLDIAAKKFIDRSHFISEASHDYDKRTSCWSDGPDLTCGEDLRGSVLLVGDSHAGSLRPGFFKAIKSINLKPRFRDGYCLFAAFDRNVKAAEASGCDEIGIRLQAEIISQKPKVIVFLICGRIHNSCPEGLESEREEDWINAGTKALQPILDAGFPIALVRDLPVLTPDPRYAWTVARSVFNLPIRNFEIDERYKQISRTRFERLFFKLQPSKSELFEVDFLGSICSEDLCNAKTRAGLDVWRDADHLSVEGSIEIANDIAREVLEKIKD